MKKILKLFLCLLMFISFTNITKALPEEEEESEFLSINDVFEKFQTNNFIRAIMVQARNEDPNAEFVVELDEDKHTINLYDGEEILLSFDYTDEYVAYYGHEPESYEEATSLENFGKVIAEAIYTQNMLYAILDAAGYSDKDIELPEELEEADEEFYSQYGLYLENGEYEFGEKPSEEEQEQEEEQEEEQEQEELEAYVQGTYFKEIRISLSKEKIAALVEEFGVKRMDYLAEVVGKPVVSIAKKKDTLVLTWAKDELAKSFEVYRSEKKDGKYTKVATVKTNSYTDKKVKYGKTYYYKVKAIGKKAKETSAVKSFKMNPAKVKNVKLSAIKTNSIKVSYDKEAATGYVIERSTDQKKWTVVKTITKNSTLSYTDSKLKANKTYYYRVRAYKKASGKKIYGAYSDIVSAKTAPEAPKLTVKSNTYNSLKLTVSEVKGATKYVVQRSDKKDGKFVDLEQTELSFVDEELKNGKTYYYKVKACNEDNKCSSYSKVASAKVEIKKPKLTASASKKSPVTLTISNVKNTEGFEIYRSTDKKKYTKIATIENIEELTYVDTTSKKNKTYYYKVRTFVTVDEKKIYSSYSDVKSIKALYTAPKEETATPKQALSVLEFVGKYKKGNINLSIFSISEEYNDVLFNEGHAGASFDMAYVDGELIYSDEYGTVTIQRADGEGNRVIVTGVGGNLDGIYTGTGFYSSEEYFEDHGGSTKYLETAYNGKFTNETDEILYLFQNEEDKVLLDMASGNMGVAIELTIGEDKAVVEDEEESYELVIDENTAIVRHFIGEELDYEKTFTKAEDLSLEEIIQRFA